MINLKRSDSRRKFIMGIPISVRRLCLVNIVPGPLWAVRHRWIPLTKGQWYGALKISLAIAWRGCWTESRYRWFETPGCSCIMTVIDIIIELNMSDYVEQYGRFNVRPQGGPKGPQKTFWDVSHKLPSPHSLPAWKKIVSEATAPVGTTSCFQTHGVWTFSSSCWNFSSKSCRPHTERKACILDQLRGVRPAMRMRMICAFIIYCLLRYCEIPQIITPMTFSLNENGSMFRPSPSTNNM